jgi:hypothetical protein
LTSPKLRNPDQMERAMLSPKVQTSRPAFPAILGRDADDAGPPGPDVAAEPRRGS